MSAPLSSQESSRAHVESNEDSDSDWDEDEDFVAKKINIRIKPVAEMASSAKIVASADELRASMGTWKSMANINLVKPNSRRSIHQSSIVLNKMYTDSNYELTELHSAHRNKDESHKHLMQPYSTFAHTSPLYELPMFNQPPGTHDLKALTVAPSVMAQAQPNRMHLPVAFATQECLNVHALMGSEGEISTSLIGHIQVAVPRSIIEMNESYFKNNDLVMRIRTNKRWTSLRTNREFVRKLEDDDESHQEQRANGINYLKLMSLDMVASYNHARQLYQKQPGSKYFLLPELVGYTIRSQDNARTVSSANGPIVQHFNEAAANCQQISPIRAVVNWLCALSVTKVRVDMDFLDNFVDLEDGIRPQDVRNIKLSMEINGNVVSQQSKPEAAWCPIESRLTWSFASYQELISLSPVSGATSCLAKLTLGDGPSTPSVSSLQFSIIGKTISGIQMTVVQDSDARLAYKLTRQKKEVRTGFFRCESRLVCEAEKFSSTCI